MEGRTKEEELAALDMVIKALQERAKVLRDELPAEMAARKVELVSAYTDDGAEKIAKVRYVAGNVGAHLADEKAALEWCAQRYPERLQDVVIIDPGFIVGLLGYAKRVCKPGESGVDPNTGERLDFIKVERGNPYVKVEATEEGRERVAAFVKRITPELTA